MAESNEAATQRGMSTGVAAELVAAGFDAPEEIGRGGFGVVYRCREPALERVVAVKLLTSEVGGDERVRFVREQQALGRLSGHPHIVQILHIDITATGRPYLVMPFYARGSLDRLLRVSGPLRWPDAVSLGVKTAGALAAAHARGIVHRDVKPGNILLTDYGEPQLSDFGIARFGDDITATSALVHGTPGFTAPEVLRGATPTPAADVYGLAATLFCLLSGHSPAWRQGSGPLRDIPAAEVARRVAAAPPNLREHDVPEVVCAALESALATDPRDRPGTASEFGERLRAAQRDTGQPVDVMAVPRDSGLTAAVSPQVATPLTPLTPPTPPFAATKFRPPAVTRTLIDRPRLLEVLRHGERRRLVVIHGPAGFGKTTLAAQWARRLRDEGVPVTWLTADPDDDNVVWFLTHLVEAIRRVRPELARELGALLQERSSDATRSVLSALIDEIHDSRQPVVLVIDDWHRVSGAGTRAAMTYLLENGCHHLRIVIVGRDRSGLPLSKLMVNDELVEIDTTALRFDADETGDFLIGASGLALNADEVGKVRRSTEGWPAGLRLAQLSLSGRDDPAEFIDNLSGRHHAIGEYLTENVLASLDPQLLDFLMATTITIRISAGLATALSGRADSREVLEQIADRNLFLQRQDDNDEWFRYHRLFADHLQRRLGYLDPDRVQILHARASAWFAEHDLLTEAVDHALAAADPQRAVDLVESHALPLVQASQMATFLGLMAKLPSPLTDDRPRLQLCVAWANAGLGRSTKVRAALSSARTALTVNPLTAAEDIRFRVEADLVSGLESYLADRYEPVSEFVTTHIDSLADSMLAQSAADLLAIEAFNHFDAASMETWYRAALRYARDVSPAATIHTHCIAGLAAAERLDTDAADRHYAAAYNADGMVPGTDLAARALILADALLGALRYRQGRLAEADTLLSRAAGAHRQPGTGDFLLDAYCTGARLAALLGDTERALRMLTAADRFAAELAMPRLTARVINERIRLRLSIPDDVRARLRQLPPYERQDTRVLCATGELEQDSAIRLALAQGSPEAVAAACERAGRLAREIDPRRVQAQAEAQLLYACCLWAAGRADDARAAALPAITLCTERGVPRLIEDTGPVIAEIVAVTVPNPAAGH
ncbi:serine/threonine-protein kinase [Nocardia sp. alder85J]|uniref:serine/threonine-protein kinase n=1 Tax=Nocardia sp. alder85J TaxID=2862949 RepID=UPI001CD424D0|nr:serine/threonine-protein kinase [Nocardia sp. alder85J]MCX4094390.1 protein kinase [Nocardia sp. alder85J]